MTNDILTKEELRGKAGKSLKGKVLLAALVLAAASAGGWYMLGSGASKAPTYRTAEIVRGDLVVTVTANGTLNPVRTVSIGSELSGIVREVNVDVNSQVKEGDTLIELDTANLTANANQARATLSSAKASLAQAQATQAEATAKMKRYEELNKTSGGKLPSRSEMDEQKAAVLKAKAGVLSAKAAIEDAQAKLQTSLTNLSKASIKSPVDGVVLARSVEPGYAVAASLQAVELLTVATDLRKLELLVDVDEADVGQVEAGQKATFTVASYPNKRFAADLTKVAFGSTSNDNVITYATYLMVDNPEMHLRPGMTATATIETAHRENVLLVPNTALRFKPRASSEQKSSGISSMMGPPHRPSASPKSAKEVTRNQSERTQTVYVVGASGTAEPREVVTGLTDGRVTEIVRSNLQAGDQVITDQLKALKK